MHGTKIGRARARPNMAAVDRDSGGEPSMPALGLDIGWDNQTSTSASSRLDSLMSRSAQRLSALASGDTPLGAPPSRRRPSGALGSPASADATVDTAAMLEMRRRRLAGELEVEHDADIRSVLKMAALWPSPKRAINELLTVQKFVSFRTPLSKEYHARLASLYEQSGSVERARAVRLAAGIDSGADGGNSGVYDGGSDGSGNPEMAKLLDMSIPDPFDD